MTPEQREELKAAALAADQEGQHIYTNPRDLNNWSNNETWHAAASPAVVLSLIAQVEALTRKEKALQGMADLRYAEVLELTAQLSEALTVPQWISVEDRLPPVGEEVIVFVPGGRVPVTALMRLIRWEGATDFYWDNAYPGKGNMHIATSITHWKPMDAAPTIPAIPGTKEGA